MSQPLEVTHEGRVLRLTLARPEKRNALNQELCRALVDQFEGAQQDQSVGAILLDAKGEVFCSGMDLEEALKAGPAEGLTLHDRLFTIGSRSAKPIVVAVQGPAIAGGTGLVANAHIALAAHGSSFGVTELRVGMWPFVISRALVSALGERRALELTLSARIFAATEAKDYGLVHEVVPPMELEERAITVATQLANWPSSVMRFGMAYTHQARLVDQERAGQIALALRAENFRSADFAEGVQAFKEKRRPEWPSNQGNQ